MDKPFLFSIINVILKYNTYELEDAFNFITNLLGIISLEENAKYVPEATHRVKMYIHQSTKSQFSIHCNFHNIDQI